MRGVFIGCIAVLAAQLYAQELQIQAQSFQSDEKSGISIFDGNVSIKKGNDELNASRVEVYTDEKKRPLKFVASGGVSFYLEDKKGSLYSGNAQKVIYIPDQKEYHFYKDVHLRQLDEKKEIHGDEVVLKMEAGWAHAKGFEKAPVIMTFELDEEKEK